MNAAMKVAVDSPLSLRLARPNFWTPDMFGGVGHLCAVGLDPINTYLCLRGTPQKSHVL